MMLYINPINIMMIKGAVERAVKDGVEFHNCMILKNIIIST
jgi:hypothetical protein